MFFFFSLVPAIFGLVYFFKNPDEKVIIIKCFMSGYLFTFISNILFVLDKKRVGAEIDIETEAEIETLYQISNLGD